MDAKKEYLKFIERYPNFSSQIISYEKFEKNALKFKLSDGRTALYYPMNVK